MRFSSSFCPPWMCWERGRSYWFPTPEAIAKPQSFSGYACSKQATYISWITDEAGKSMGAALLHPPFRESTGRADPGIHPTFSFCIEKYFTWNCGSLSSQPGPESRWVRLKITSTLGGLPKPWEWVKNRFIFNEGRPALTFTASTGFPVLLRRAPSSL